jgi:prophage regulatory protein
MAIRNLERSANVQERSALMDDDRFLRLPELTARYGCSRATVYAWISRNGFPKPVKLGPRLAAWRSQDLATWETSRRGGAPTRRLRPPAIARPDRL